MEYDIQVCAIDLSVGFSNKIDYYTKWIELEKLNKNTFSDTVISHLKKMFSRLGIPSVIVSDGGPQFSSRVFHNFTMKWDIEHVMSSPRNPQSNGQVERAKQTFKKLLSEATKDKRDVEIVLLNYRNTPID